MSDKMTKKRAKEMSKVPSKAPWWEELLKRFCHSLSECKTIDKRISECQILVASCRTAEAGGISSAASRAFLAMHLAHCHFTPDHPDDLDSVAEHLDCIRRGNEKLMREEEKAVCALMRLPFACLMLPSDTQDLDSNVRSIVSRAEQTLCTADVLTKEFILAGLICDIVDAVERFARQDKRDNGKMEDISKQLKTIQQSQSVMATDIAKLYAVQNSKRGQKPPNTIPLADAVTIMQQICNSDRVCERTLRRWCKLGVASRSGLPIGWNNFADTNTWTAWCNAYRERMTARMKTRQYLDEHRVGAVGELPARPSR